jgi:transposase-like protein
MAEVVTIDKSGANTAVLTTLNAGKLDEATITIRQSKYLNNLIERDHRNIKGLCWDSNRFDEHRRYWSASS